MASMKRRGFLQQLGWAIATLGVSETGIAIAGDRYARLLAQPARRKLALLVGIDRYPETIAEASSISLRGCRTDVELQRQLLVHRFGFAPDDILVLSDREATRDRIETAFREHLGEQAEPGDLAVFHFSGYGGRVRLSPDADRLQNCLVPVDSQLPTAEEPVTNDLLEETLWLLLRSLPTQNVVTILDTSYVYPGRVLQGNLRIRARPTFEIAQASAEELEFQQQLRRKSEFLKRFSDRVPGAVLLASDPKGLATEKQWPGFSAGLFTYGLTQSLWRVVTGTSVQTSLQRASCLIEPLAARVQKPQLLDRSGLSIDAKFPLAIADRPLPGADGVAIAVAEDGQSGEVWLGGLPPLVLETYGDRSILSPLATGEDEEPLRLQVRDRQGLRAQVQLSSDRDGSQGSLHLGQLLREEIRVIPRDLNLIVALDSSLQRIERVDATSAFSSIRHVSSAVAGEQPADCLFARVRQTTVSDKAAVPASAQGSYGLFTSGQEPIPISFGKGEEAVKTGVERLSGQLHTLLASKLLRASANQGSSRLGVQAALIVQEDDLGDRVLFEMATSPAIARNQLPKFLASGTQPTNQVAIELTPGTSIYYWLHNHGDRPLYFLLFGLDSSGRAISFYPLDPEAEKTSAQLAQAKIDPDRSMTIPLESDGPAWVIRGPKGIAETQIICSDRPFKKTLDILEATMQPSRDARPIDLLQNPLDVARAVLQDLSDASAEAVRQAGLSTDDFALDTRAWATLSFIYRVV